MDTIREEDKYGNTGDRHAFIGRGVVAGFEGFSRILNKALDVSSLPLMSCHLLFIFFLFFILYEALVLSYLLFLFQFPFETVKKVSRSATEALNNLGSRLIGL